MNSPKVKEEIIKATAEMVRDSGCLCAMVVVDDDGCAIGFTAQDSTALLQMMGATDVLHAAIVSQYHNGASAELEHLELGDKDEGCH